jgi:hypothetical protein
MRNLPVVYFYGLLIAMKKKRGGREFWNAEYKEAGHLALSLNPSEDLQKFTRWFEREEVQSSTSAVAMDAISIGFQKSLVCEASATTFQMKR